MTARQKITREGKAAVSCCQRRRAKAGKQLIAVNSLDQRPLDSFSFSLSQNDACNCRTAAS